MQEGSAAIILLLSELVPLSEGRLYMDLAPANAQTPYSIYRIVGNDEEEDLAGNVQGGGYVVQIDSSADNPLAAREESATIRRAIEGSQVTSEGLSVRVDFDSERTLGAGLTDDSKNSIFTWSVDYTIWPGV